MGLAVIDVPHGPPGWEDGRAQLLRIVDPLGRAVAWFAPDHGAMCAGFAVRSSGQQGTEWKHILHAREPWESSPLLTDVGCVVQCTQADAPPQLVQRWLYVARDPTALAMETVIPVDTGDRHELHLHLTAHLDAAALVLDLDARNRSASAISPQIAFHLSFVRGLLAGGHAQECPVVPDHAACASDGLKIASRAIIGPAPLALISAPGCNTRTILALAPGESSVYRTLPFASEAGALALRAYASPRYRVPLLPGARSQIGISIRALWRDNTPS